MTEENEAQETQRNEFEPEGIPLEHAMVVWTNTLRNRGFSRVAVVRHPEDGASARWASCSLGACCSPWDDISNDQRLLLLFKIMSILINTHKFSYEDVHTAFLTIPEYAHATDLRESFKFERQ